MLTTNLIARLNTVYYAIFALNSRLFGKYSPIALCLAELNVRQFLVQAHRDLGIVGHCRYRQRLAFVLNTLDRTDHAGRSSAEQLE